MDDKQKLANLELKLQKYREILADKKKNFRGVKHENSLSELRYTQYMVYRDMVDNLDKEVKELKLKLGRQVVK